jgi:hypothetical protein
MNSQPSRLEQLGNLMTAMIAVIVTGTFNSKVIKRSGKPLPNTFAVEKLRKINRLDFRTGGRYNGAMKKVAHELGVCRGSVEAAAQGRVKSGRILDALVKEIDRRDREAEIRPLPITEEERAAFGRGGKYYGVNTRVARQLGMLPNNAHRVLRGKYHSPNILRALRAEMARIDADLAGGAV